MLKGTAFWQFLFLVIAEAAVTQKEREALQEYLIKKLS